jgi:hypothetical protein
MHVRQMVIVVVGHEDRPIQEAHGLLEARVDRGTAHFLLREGIHATHEVHPAAAQALEDSVYRQPVVVRGLGGAVLEVGDRQVWRAGEVIVQPLVVEHAQIGEVGDVFLYRPLSIHAPCEHFGWQSGHQFGSAGWRAAQTFEHGGKQAEGLSKREGAVEPTCGRYHMVRRVLEKGRPPGPALAGYRAVVNLYVAIGLRHVEWMFI